MPEAAAETTNEDEVVVALEPELPLGGDKKDPAKEAADALTSQYKDLQAQVARERADKEAANARAAAAVAEAQRARGAEVEAHSQVIDTQADTIAAGMNAAKNEIESAKREAKVAAEAGDWDKQSDAMDRLSAARAKLVRLEEADADIATRKARMGDQTRRTEAPQAPASSADPVEAYISGRTEPTQNWLRAHKDWITDKRKNAKLTAAHHNAVAEGLNPDTAEYFDHVETFIGLKENGQAQNGAASATKPARRAAAPVAPAASTGGGASGGNGTEVRLSKDEAKAATDGTLVWNYDDPSGQKKFKKGDPIGIQEMARRKLELTKQGAYDRSYVSQ